METPDVVIEQLTVSHTVNETSTSGSPGLSGHAFTSWTIKRKNGQPFSVEEARAVTLKMHEEVTGLSLVEAVARNVFKPDTVRQIRTHYHNVVDSVLSGLKGSQK